MRLHGRRLSERLMRPAGVAEALEFGQLGVQGADARLAQAPLPAAGRGPGAADRLQGGRLRGALNAKLVEQRELVEALGGLRRKFVADRIETTESAVRTFGLHGAFPAFRLLDLYCKHYAA